MKKFLFLLLSLILFPNGTFAFSDINADSVEERQKSYDEILSSPLVPVWEYWKELSNKKENISLVTNILIQKIREDEDEKIYTEMKNMLQNADISDRQHAEIAHVLGEISTKKSLSILIQILQETNNETLQYAVAEAIGNGTTGLGEFELRFHTELSPILESLWKKLDKADYHTTNAIAKRIAEIGAPSGIEVLLLTISEKNQTIQYNNDYRIISAFNNMKEVRNPDSLKILQQNLKHQSTSSDVFIASGTAISSIANKEATQILWDWAREVPDSMASLVQQWIGTVAGRDLDALQLLRKNIRQRHSYSFKSKKIQNIIKSIIRKY